MIMYLKVNAMIRFNSILEEIPQPLSTLLFCLFDVVTCFYVASFLGSATAKNLNFCWLFKMWKRLNFLLNSCNVTNVPTLWDSRVHWVNCLLQFDSSVLSLRNFIGVLTLNNVYGQLFYRHSSLVFLFTSIVQCKRKVSGWLC